MVLCGGTVVLSGWVGVALEMGRKRGKVWEVRVCRNYQG
jgi:hypothetical protein